MPYSVDFVNVGLAYEPLICTALFVLQINTCGRTYLYVKDGLE
jgi:hypothetical protein